MIQDYRQYVIDRIENYKIVEELLSELEAKDKEIERLKDLIEPAFQAGRNCEFLEQNQVTAFEDFKSENNL